MYFHFRTLGTILVQTLSPKQFHLRHALLGMLFLSLFLILRSLVWMFRKIDRVIFPQARQQSVRAPIFIVGNPRSGTTFLHRLMALDPQFTYLKLYQTIFPSVCLARLFAFLGRVDDKLGRPLHRVITRVSRAGLKGWENIHPTDQSKAESDEMYFVYAMLSPLLTLQFPFFQQLRFALYPDTLPQKEREKLKAFYFSCLQGHLYAEGEGKTLLEKVALIAGRINIVQEVFPDMRVIHMVRHPYQSIPSLISMFQVPWRTLAPQALKDAWATKGLQEMIFEYYRITDQLRQTLPTERFQEVRYEDLAADPAGTVESIYSRLNISMSASYRHVLAAEAEKAKQYTSTHTYSLEGVGLEPREVVASLHDLFEAHGYEK